jgi:hypothetical protein
MAHIARLADKRVLMDLSKEESEALALSTLIFNSISPEGVKEVLEKILKDAPPGIVNLEVEHLSATQKLLNDIAEEFQKLMLKEILLSLKSDLGLGHDDQLMSAQ